MAYQNRAARPMTMEELNSIQLPFNAEAENSVISAMFQSPDVLEECLTRMVEEDFYFPVNRTVFSAMHELFDTARPTDPITVADHLKSKKKLDSIGGPATLLDYTKNSLALGEWQRHLEMVLRDSTLRHIISTAAEINALALDAPEDTKEVVDKSEQMLLNVTNRAVRTSYSTVGDIMEGLYNDLVEMDRDPDSGARGVETGFKRLDRDLLGLRPGQMIVVGARPAVGKTSFALNLAVNMASRGAHIAFFSLEMSKLEIGQRLLASRSGVPLQKIRAGKIGANDWEAVFKATAELSELPLMIDDTPGTTITEIRAKARRMLHGKEKGAVIIDYLQLVSPPSGRYRADSRATEVSEMSRGIKILAKDLSVPVVALSQLSRTVEGRTGKRPQLSDLRESGAIEQDADIVLMLDRSMTEEEGERPDRPDYGTTNLIIAKNRSGPTDTIPLVFLPDKTSFVEVDTFHTD